MSNTPLLNIIVLQYGDTPIVRAQVENQHNCIATLQRAMVCYYGP